MLLIASQVYAAYFPLSLRWWVLLTLVLLILAFSIVGLVISKEDQHKKHAAVLDFIIALFPVVMVGVFFFIAGGFNGIG